MLAEMDRDATVARLAPGKKIAKAQGKCVDVRHAFGEHPTREYDWEREVVARIAKMRAGGLSFYAIAKHQRQVLCDPGTGRCFPSRC